jgi:hypothetical protein
MVYGRHLLAVIYVYELLIHRGRIGLLKLISRVFPRSSKAKIDKKLIVSPKGEELSTAHPAFYGI